MTTATAPEVVVYRRRGWPYCTSLRRGLQQACVPYREVDIWSDRRRLRAGRSGAVVVT